MDATAVADKALVAAAQQTVDQYQAMTNFKKSWRHSPGLSRRAASRWAISSNSAGADASLHATSQAPFSVADVSKLRIFVSVPQDFGAMLKPGLKADLTCRAPRVKRSRPIPDHGGRRQPFYANHRHRIGRRQCQEGLFARGLCQRELQLPERSRHSDYSLAALLFRAEGMQVALVDGQNHVHLQNVSLGHNLGLDVQIIAGLKADDRIVANPSLGLLEGQQVKVVQAAKGYEPGESRAPTRRRRRRPTPI